MDKVQLNETQYEIRKNDSSHDMLDTHETKDRLNLAVERLDSLRGRL